MTEWQPGDPLICRVRINEFIGGRLCYLVKHCPPGVDGANDWCRVRNWPGSGEFWGRAITTSLLRLASPQDMEQMRPAIARYLLKEKAP